MFHAYSSQWAREVYRTTITVPTHRRPDLSEPSAKSASSINEHRFLNRITPLVSDCSVIGTCSFNILRIKISVPNPHVVEAHVLVWRNRIRFWQTPNDENEANRNYVYASGPNYYLLFRINTYKKDPRSFKNQECQISTLQLTENHVSEWYMY